MENYGNKSNIDALVSDVLKRRKLRGRLLTREQVLDAVEQSYIVSFGIRILDKDALLARLFGRRTKHD